MKEIDHLLDGFWLDQKGLGLKYTEIHWEPVPGTHLSTDTNYGSFLKKVTQNGLSMGNNIFRKEKTRRLLTISLNTCLEYR